MEQNRLPLLSIFSLTSLALLLAYLFLKMYLYGGNEQICAFIMPLKAAGLLASFLLVLGTVDAPVFKKFCPRNPWFNCRKVIDSPAGIMFHLIHTADLGVLYFSGTMLVLALSAFTSSFYHHVLLLGLLNLLTLPYTVFSIAYQIFKVGKGCALCLIVQAVFWLEFWQFYPFIFGTNPEFTFNPIRLYAFILGMGLPLFSWPLLRLLLEKTYNRNSIQDRDDTQD